MNGAELDRLDDLTERIYGTGRYPMNDGHVIAESRRIHRAPATREYAAEVRRKLGEGFTQDQAEQVADLIIREIDDEAIERARVVPDLDGNPVCSWCAALAGLCHHIAGKTNP